MVTIPKDEATILIALAEGDTPVQAVEKAGHTLTPANAKVMANHVWAKYANANQGMLEAMSGADISPSLLAGKLRELLDAKATININKMPYEVPDNSAQLKALDLAMKITGGYAPTKHVAAVFSFEAVLDELTGGEDDDQDSEPGAEGVIR